MTMLLPAGFADLEPFLPRFAGATAFDRDAVRGAASAQERTTFHAAFAPRLAAVLDRLNQTPLGLHDEAEQRLMRLALTYAHVAQAVEVQGPDEARHTLARARLPITRAPADI